jgi:hypothetical protein
VPASTNDEDLPIEIKLGTTAPICLVTGNLDINPSAGGYSTDAGGLVNIRANLVDGHRIVELSYQNRNDLKYYRWNLDA